MSALVVLLQAAACVGFGAIVLRFLGQLRQMDRFAQWTWSFAVGFGVLGWILFFLGVAGLLSIWPLASVLVLGIIGLFALAVPAEPHPSEIGDPLSFGVIDATLLLFLAVILLFDFFEGISPPADADTMAYHFAIPKNFLAIGAIEFVPRAADGAIPLLTHMTYLAPLKFGGEKSLTLWTMLSGWATSALVYSLARRFVDRRWSLVVALLFLTTPAVVFGAGSGHVEVRNAMFALIGAFSVALAWRTDNLRTTVLAGLAVGFFMGGKFLGVMFAGAAGIVLCGLALYSGRRWIAHGVVLTAVALVAGGQWYVWNWIHTGDPIFPALFNFLEYRDPALWNTEHWQSLRDYINNVENRVPNNLLWFFAYPFVATISGFPEFESGRIGLGPLLLLILPFAAAAAWRFRDRLSSSPLLPVFLIAVCYYAIWFFAGPSQRVRHLVPIYPILLICGIVAAEHWAAQTNNIRTLGLAIFLTMGIQIAGHGIVSVNYIRYVFSDESRKDFLIRNVGGFEAVSWINDNLKESDRIFLTQRHLNYLIDIPIYYAHFIQEALIDIRPGIDAPETFLRQLRRQGINHLLVTDGGKSTQTSGSRQWKRLEQGDCLELVRKFDTIFPGSRSLPSLSRTKTSVLLFRLKDSQCEI